MWQAGFSYADAKVGIVNRLHYIIGSSISKLADYSVASGILKGRLPAGVHFESDWHRFLKEPPQVIVDCGANVGQTVMHWKRLWPKSIVHSFEPFLSTFNELEINCRGLSGVYTHKLALGESQKVSFVESQLDSQLNSLKDESKAGERIEVVRLDQFCLENAIGEIDLLKIDVEGFELEVLSGTQEMLNKGKVKAVFAECGFIKKDKYKVYFADLDEFLIHNGFYLSGFYELFHFGETKSHLGFGNAFWIRE